jgi:hypothetical protein
VGRSGISEEPCATAISVGPAGFVLAVARRDGRAIEGLVVDACQIPPQPMPPELLAQPEKPLTLTYLEGRHTVTLGDLVLFKNVSLHAIPNRHRIGLATWGPSLGIAALELERAVPAK